MKRRKRLIAMSVLAALIAAGVIVWRMTAMAPTWYAPPNRNDPQVALLADKVENRLLEEAQKVREPANVWTLRVRESQVNAWLSARLPQWIAHEQHAEWPEQLGTPQVKIDAEGLSLALPLKGTAITSRCIVAHVNAEMTDGRLTMHVDRVALGRLALPGEPVANLLRTLQGAWPSIADDQRIQQVMDIVAGKRSIDPVTRLADHRRLRLKGFQLGDGWIDFTVQTLDPSELSSAMQPSQRTAER